MSPSTHAGAGAARVVVALMRAVAALFATGWLVVAAVWLLDGRLEPALAAAGVAAVVAGLGMLTALLSHR
jgi:hypothetical protein